MTTKKKTDIAWEPVVKHLLLTLKDNGFILHSVIDGEEEFSNPSLDKAVEVICSVDMSELEVKTQQEDKPLWMLIVLGNMPEELVADCTARDTPAGKLLDQTLTNWSQQWEGAPQLTVGLVELLKTIKL